MTASPTKRGHPKDDFMFEQFGAHVIPGGKKTAVVHCKHCSKKSLYHFLVGQDGTKTPQASHL
eukprot:9032799-Ditylum_brightwellii.AAC.1